VNDIHNVSGPLNDALERTFQLAATLGAVMQQGLVERGLTRARASVVWQLHHRGPVTQRELSQALNVTPRNITTLLDALQTAGFVSRSPHPTDRRATLVALTDHGRSTATRLHTEYKQLADVLFADISARDVTAYNRTIDRVLTRLNTVDFSEIAGGTPDTA
jgi:DNA-binding MarR family transcriptional regulator